MQESFKAFRIYAGKEFERAGIETLTLDDLSDGDVVIKVEYSSVNYKDALAGSGEGKILRKSPLNGGIDLAGIVVSSENNLFTSGQSVLVNGSGLSEVHDGGYSQYARVPAEWVVPMPAGLNAKSSMILGTAGFTAGMAIQRLQDNHQTPDQGPMLVTGASGGVGSFAVELLAQLGYEVVAMTRKQQQHDYLYSLGASKVVSNDVMHVDDASLHKGLWGGAIDNLGGDTLAWLTKSVKPWGNIVSIGMAGGINVNTSAMPFILRGISLLGVTSAACPQDVRKQIWQKLGNELLSVKLDKICTAEVGLEQLPQAFENLLKGELYGRQIVRL
ncbi:MAG: YhdH/YhfP family quinone oxidoreductase [Gammaproteobacteria bacterium]|nr:YhdH/YhfP family quinone oxidoreductase [Gammaproteobacteria bacterium]